MKVTELRIGNWVKDNDVDWDYQVTSLQLMDSGEIIVNGNDIDENPCSSIPLAEEWLEKFEFEKGEDCDYEKDGFKLWSYGEGKTGFYHINSELILYFDNVHDIQNGWKVIMEEELTIKETA